MGVPLLDLPRQHERVRTAVADGVAAVFASQQFILGKTVEDFEKSFADLIGVPHAVGMSSGTDAQLAILMAMGIGEGDAVITTPYTFFATAGCIHRVGAETVFIDIDPATYLIDLTLLEQYLESRQRDDQGFLLTDKGARIKAIIPVHLFGVCVAADVLQNLSAKYSVPVIEDAAQAVGAEFRSWTTGEMSRAGAIGDSAYFSFFPTKNLGAAGDAGISVCKDADFANKLRLVRNHGMEQRYYHRVVGGNFRLDALQAAVLQAKMPLVHEWNSERRGNATDYRDGFTAAGLLDFVTLPAEPWYGRAVENHHIYHQYVLRAHRRDELMAHLQAHKIGCAVYYPVPLHRQECFAYLGYEEGSLPHAEAAARETLALPIFAELRSEEIKEVVDTIAKFYKG